MAKAALSGLPGINLTSWIPPPWNFVSTCSRSPSPPMLSPYQPTLGIVMVPMIAFEPRFHRRRVLSETLPRLGFKIERGTIKSEVRIMFLSQSTLRPCGLKLSASMLAFDATSVSFGCSAMMLKLLSVSTSRPGEVPAAATVCQFWPYNNNGAERCLQPMYVIRNPLQSKQLADPDLSQERNAPIRLGTNFIGHC